MFARWLVTFLITYARTQPVSGCTLVRRHYPRTLPPRTDSYICNMALDGMPIAVLISTYVYLVIARLFSLIKCNKNRCSVVGYIQKIVMISNVHREK